MGRAVRRLGLDLDRPLVSQLMRLDRWGDPHTAIEAFTLVRERLPQLQLVIACQLGEGADGWPAVKEISDYAAGQEDLHLLTSYSELGNFELGALNRLSRVALRLSLREGFGLGASEAMWRGTPVVGSRRGRHAAAGARRRGRLPGHGRGSGRRRAWPSWSPTRGSRWRWGRRAASGSGSGSS